MTEQEIQAVESNDIAKFLNTRKDVQQTDVRLALADAFRRIADLTARLEHLERAKSP